MLFDESFEGLSPLNFFSLVLCASQKGIKLPSLCDLLHEEHFADLSLGWSPQGLHCRVQFHKPFAHTAYPNLQGGDSVEIFVDTRDNKASGIVGKYCHHFYFLPKDNEGNQAGEITRFRTDDLHELSDPKHLHVETKFHELNYTMDIHIPAEALYGYDPEEFPRIGFAYRINRFEGSSQNFCAAEHEFFVEQQPSLWFSVNLI